MINILQNDRTLNRNLITWINHTIIKYNNSHNTKTNQCNYTRTFGNMHIIVQLTFPFNLIDTYIVTIYI